jgi:hypothetical protein
MKTNFLLFSLLIIFAVAIMPQKKAYAAKNLKHEYNIDYRKAIIYLKTVNIAMPKSSSSKIPTFGFTKLGLRALIFNVINTSYRQSISSAENGEGPNVGTSSSAYAAAAKDNAVIDTFFRNTQNMSVDYGTVDNFYAEALKAIYGDIQTSSLKIIGIGVKRDISYQTILRKTNVFLNRIRDTQKNRQRFSYLFNVTFKKGSEISSGNNNGIPRSLQKYYAVNRNTVNFYSLTYYLFHNIYYTHGNHKRIAEKLLSYLIKSHYNKAEFVFYNIHISLQNSHNSIKTYVDMFLTFFENNNINELKGIIGYFQDPQRLVTIYSTTVEHNNNIPGNEFTSQVDNCQTEQIKNGKNAGGDGMNSSCTWVEIHTPYVTHSCPLNYHIIDNQIECIRNNSKKWIYKMNKIYRTMLFLVRIKFISSIKGKMPWQVDERYEALKLALKNYNGGN